MRLFLENFFDKLGGVDAKLAWAFKKSLTFGLVYSFADVKYLTRLTERSVAGSTNVKRTHMKSFFFNSALHPNRTFFLVFSLIIRPIKKERPWQSFHTGDYFL